MDISPDLNKIIVAAYHEAESRGHEYLTPEHVLFASLFFDRGKEIILSCGGNIESLARDLEEFFKTRFPVAESSKPIQSAGFQSVMENAILHTASAEKDSVEIDDILASIMEEKESFAAHFLARQGIDRLAAAVLHLPRGHRLPGNGRRGGRGARREEGDQRGRGAGERRAAGKGPRRAAACRHTRWISRKRRAPAASTRSSAARRSSSAPSRCSAAG